MPIIADALLFSLIASGVAFLHMIATPRPREPEHSLVWLLRVALVTGLSTAAFYGATRDEIATGACAAVMFVAVLWFARLFRNWDARGHLFFASFIGGLIVFLAYDQERIVTGHLQPYGIALSNVLFFLEAASALITVYYAFEVLNVMCRVIWKRKAMPVNFATGYKPKVSVQIPAHAEPVEMVMETLEAVANLDYDNYEVIMIDDNTDDSELWRPIMDFCAEKGFKVFHLADYPGFKSGALNFALTQTASDAEIIAVVDADYIVEPEYLRETVAYFQNPAVAFLQTPQAFCNMDGYPFRESSSLAQSFFFEIGMVSRNERNSIIFCGTMGMIRKNVLREIGGWSEWCITEDAEASLRILRNGYESVYLNKVYGRGLLPETFDDAKKQRFRWAFGGVQILKRYWRYLLPFGGGSSSKRLTAAQRTDYLMGFLGWFNELLILGFTLFILVTAVSYIAGFELPVRRLIGLALIFPVLAIATGTLRVGWALRSTTHCSWSQGFAAFISMLSLSFTIAQACVSALTHKKGVFLRTPKTAEEGDVIGALRVTMWEALLGTSLVAGAIGLLVVTVTTSTVLLAALLLWHSVIYLSAVRSAITAYWRPRTPSRPVRAQPSTTPIQAPE